MNFIGALKFNYEFKFYIEFKYIVLVFFLLKIMSIFYVIVLKSHWSSVSQLNIFDRKTYHT